jgi:adenylate cyclase
MADARVERRLAAILAADVAGYSRLMGVDEEGTLAALKEERTKVVDPKIAEHRGRIVKTTGDGALVEFASAVDAVRCAMEIQRAMGERNAAIPEDRRIEFRIGINVGDIIVDKDDIYGDGVNIAARIEALASPGAICLSDNAYQQIKGKVSLDVSDMGEQQLKNIAQPVRAFSVRLEGMPVRPSPALPDTPSIAVLPFTNMSGDPEQEYFADGITDDIITDLSKIAGLLVIARNSSFAYKGKSVDIRTIGRELGVRSLLEGSIRRAGNRVRITAQLINAANGAHLWAERYDRDLTDIFAVQDEVTRHIVDALKIKLTSDEALRIADIPTNSSEAHDLFLRGREMLLGRKWDRETFDTIVAFMRGAIDLDPNYAEPYAGLGWAHLFDFHNHLTGSPDVLDLAEHFANLSIEKGPKLSFAHWIAAATATWKRNLERAKRESEIALALNPNDAQAYTTRGTIEIYSGNPLAAIPFLERAIRLDPVYTQQYIHFLGSAFLIAGNYEEAATSFRERIRLAPETDLSRALLVSALGHLGAIDEAKRVWAELKRVNPKYSFAGHLARLPFSNPADADRIKDGVAKAGLLD